jgi:hypothetical protein
MLIKGYPIKASTASIANERIITYPNATGCIRIKGHLASSLEGAMRGTIANPKDLKSMKNQPNRIIYPLMLRRRPSGKNGLLPQS